MIRYLARVEIKENGEVRKIKHTFFKNFYLTDDELEMTEIEICKNLRDIYKTAKTEIEILEYSIEVVN